MWSLFQGSYIRLTAIIHTTETTFSQINVGKAIKCHFTFSSTADAAQNGILSFVF